MEKYKRNYKKFQITSHEEEETDIQKILDNITKEGWEIIFYKEEIEKFDFYKNYYITILVKKIC